MRTRERILSIRLFEKVGHNPEFAKRIVLSSGMRRRLDSENGKAEKIEMSAEKESGVYK